MCYAALIAGGGVREREWIVPATIIVAFQYAVALILGASVGFRYSIPIAAYGTVGLTIAVLGLSLSVPFHLFRYWRESEAKPTQRLLRDLPHAFAVGAILVTLQTAALTWFKVMMPFTASFTADAALANLDHLLFGTDPWRLSHAGLAPLSLAIDLVYINWGFLKFTTLMILLSLPASRRKSQALLSYFLIVGGTALGQYLAPSAGPIFWQQLQLGDRFAELPVHEWVGAARAYLWSDYLAGGGKVGTGISAMPSLHVAIALWTALLNRAYLPRLQAIGWLYFTVILIGSVHLGWHYAVDGVVSIIGTLTFWKVAPLLFAAERSDESHLLTEHTGSVPVPETGSAV